MHVILCGLACVLSPAPREVRLLPALAALGDCSLWNHRLSLFLYRVFTAEEPSRTSWVSQLFRLYYRHKAMLCGSSSPQSPIEMPAGSHSFRLKLRVRHLSSGLKAQRGSFWGKLSRAESSHPQINGKRRQGLQSGECREPANINVKPLTHRIHPHRDKFS